MLFKNPTILLKLSAPVNKTKLLNSKNIPIHPRVKDLYSYLQSNGRIEDLEYDPNILSIFSKDILQKIKNCDEGKWEDSVPDGIAEIIKEKNLFGTSCKI